MQNKVLYQLGVDLVSVSAPVGFSNRSYVTAEKLLSVLQSRPVNFFVSATPMLDSESGAMKIRWESVSGKETKRRLCLEFGWDGHWKAEGVPLTVSGGGFRIACRVFFAGRVGIP